MTLDGREPIDTERGITAVQARGHMIRFGHELEGYWTQDRNGNVKQHYTCCNGKD